MKDYQQMTVGQIVADNFDNAALFDRYGIDFCCNGSTPLTEACTQAGVCAEQLLAELADQKPQASLAYPFVDFKSWPQELRVDYILKYHHRNIRTQGPQIERLLEKVCRVHADKHPELHQVRELFLGSLADLSSHLDKEEMMLFPYIYTMCEAAANHQRVEGFHCGSVDAPISVMMAEHDGEGERYRQISRLTNAYTPPADACDSYRLLLERLKAFEQALHHHIHLENNLVFPEAIRMECELKK